MSTDLPSYISEISFRLLRPQSRLSWPLVRFTSRPAGLRTLVEALNTRLPDGPEEQGRVGLLLSLCRIPRMSTLAIAAVINRAVRTMPDDRAFVNVGIWHGFTLFAGMAGNPDKTCVGIDNFSEYGGPREAFLERFQRLSSRNHRFFDMDYERYFGSVHKGEIGFYLYDGAHDYASQIQGLKSAEPFLAENSFVLIDDLNWPPAKQATEDFVRTSEHRYKIVFSQHTACNRHPTFWNGVMLVRRLD